MTKQNVSREKILKDKVADNIQKRRIKNANKGTFKRIWNNLFAK